MVQIKLGRPGKYMADLMPMNEIPGMKDRDTGKKFKGRCDHVIVVSFPTDGRIGIKSWEQRVMQQMIHTISPYY